MAGPIVDAAASAAAAGIGGPTCKRDARLYVRYDEVAGDRCNRFSSSADASTVTHELSQDTDRLYKMTYLTERTDTPTRDTAVHL